MESRSRASDDLVHCMAEDPAKAERVGQMLRTLGHTARVRIVAFLAERAEANVGDIARVLGLPPAITSQHLAALRLERLVSARRQGDFRYYSIAAPELRELLTCLGACCRELHGPHAAF